MAGVKPRLPSCFLPFGHQEALRLCAPLKRSKEKLEQKEFFFLTIIALSAILFFSIGIIPMSIAPGCTTFRRFLSTRPLGGSKGAFCPFFCRGILPLLMGGAPHHPELGNTRPNSTFCRLLSIWYLCQNIRQILKFIFFIDKFPHICGNHFDLHNMDPPQNLRKFIDIIFCIHLIR